MLGEINPPANTSPVFTSPFPKDVINQEEVRKLRLRVTPKPLSQRILTKRILEELHTMLENAEYEHPSEVEYFIDELTDVIHRLEKYRGGLEYEEKQRRRGG